MSKYADITFQNSAFLLSGDLDFYNVMSVYEKSLQYLDKCSALTFDFSQVKSSDSSGLALVIEWVKLANQRKKTVSFKNLSNDLQTLAAASGLNHLIVNS